MGNNVLLKPMTVGLLAFALSPVAKGARVSSFEYQERFAQGNWISSDETLALQVTSARRDTQSASTSAANVSTCVPQELKKTGFCIPITEARADGKYGAEFIFHVDGGPVYYVAFDQAGEHRLAVSDRSRNRLTLDRTTLKRLTVSPKTGVAKPGIKALKNLFANASGVISRADIQEMPTGYLIDPWHKNTNQTTWDLRPSLVTNDLTQKASLENLFSSTCSFTSMNTYGPPERPSPDKIPGLLFEPQNLAALSAGYQSLVCLKPQTKFEAYHFDSQTQPTCNSLGKSATAVRANEIRLTGKFRDLIGIDPFSYSYPLSFDEAFSAACSLESQQWGYDVCPSGTRQKFDEPSTIQIRKLDSRLVYRLSRGQVEHGYGLCETVPNKYFCYADFAIPFPRSDEGEYFFSGYEAGHTLAKAKQNFVNKLGTYTGNDTMCGISRTDLDPKTKQLCMTTAIRKMKCTSDPREVLGSNFKLRR